MNKILIMLLASLSATNVFAGEVVKALRIAPVTALSDAPQSYKVEHGSHTIPRQYVQQPPVIPHNIDNYAIDKKSNACLMCHGWGNYIEAKATKVSLTHFLSRDGVEQENISPRRYVCTTCHVPQNNTKPLVENVFQPVDMLKH